MMKCQYLARPQFSLEAEGRKLPRWLREQSLIPGLLSSFCPPWKYWSKIHSDPFRVFQRTCHSGYQYPPLNRNRPNIHRQIYAHFRFTTQNMLSALKPKWTYMQIWNKFKTSANGNFRMINIRKKWWNLKLQIFTNFCQKVKINLKTFGVLWKWKICKFKIYRKRRLPLQICKYDEYVWYSVGRIFGYSNIFEYI